MSTVASLTVKLLGDTKGLEKSFGSSLKTATKWGAGLAAAAGVAAVAIGVKAVQAAVDFEKEMANVGTLIGKEGTGKMKELSDSVKNLSESTGKPLDDLAGGMYQVVSAFGDTADSAKQLEIAAKASSAGVASTTDSVNLLSAVTKGYGDTSVKAMEKASDLAFQTVKLGQTSFPELASAMGQVIPLASTMGVTQEELFGAMATLTGVTGKTAEVTTQLRATVQGFLQPSENMAAALKELGYENGKVAIESEGLGGILNKLKEEAGGNEIAFSKLFSSVESKSAVLALTGAQADAFAEKTRAMGGAAGSTKEAFEIQQATISATFERIKASLNVVMVELGEKFLPMLEELSEWVTEHMPEIKVIMEQTFDKIVEVMTTAIEKIKTIIEWFKEYKDIIIPVVITVAALWVASWVIMAIASVVNSAIIIGKLAIVAFKWLFLGTEAKRSALKVVGSWIMMGVSAIKNTVIMVGQFVVMIAKWVWVGVQSLIHAGKVVASWVMTGLAALKNTIIMIAQSAIMVAKWVWMGAQSLLQAGRMAAAWFIAMGPIGWVIGAIVGLAAVIIANWDKIKSKTVSIWNGIVSAIRGPANSIIGIANGIIGAFEKMINFVGSAINRIPSIDIPSWVPGFGGKSFGIPNIPKVSMGRIPSLAVGTNMVRNDGLAMLHKGEEVRPANVAGGGYSGGKQEVHVTVNLDGRELTNILGPMMVDKIRGKLGSAY